MPILPMRKIDPGSVVTCPRWQEVCEWQAWHVVKTLDFTIHTRRAPSLCIRLPVAYSASLEGRPAQSQLHGDPFPNKGEPQHQCRVVWEHTYGAESRAISNLASCAFFSSHWSPSLPIPQPGLPPNPNFVKLKTEFKHVKTSDEDYDKYPITVNFPVVGQKYSNSSRFWVHGGIIFPGPLGQGRTIYLVLAN